MEGKTPMTDKPKVLTIAISSRALFNLEDSNTVFEEQGQVAFNQYCRDNEDKPLRPGVAFNLVNKLLRMNAARESPLIPRDKVDVVLLSRNSPDAGLRIMKSIQHYELDIERAVFTQGNDRFRYAKAFKADLFLSANASEVRKALEFGIAAGAINPLSRTVSETDSVVRFAFDGDSVIFSDEAEVVNHKEGLVRFQQSEQEQAQIPLGEGPFKSLLMKLHMLQKQFPDGACPLRTALVTARGVPVHERVLRTLRSWGVEMDEAIFCGGLPKGPLLEVFGADIFFDDTPKNIASASEHVGSAHVVSGVMNLVK